MFNNKEHRRYVDYLRNTINDQDNIIYKLRGDVITRPTIEELASTREERNYAENELANTKAFALQNVKELSKLRNKRR